MGEEGVQPSAGGAGPNNPPPDEWPWTESALEWNSPVGCRTRSTRLAWKLCQELKNSAAGWERVDRQYLLTLCGCARRFAHLFGPEHTATVEEAERIADGLIRCRPYDLTPRDRLTYLIDLLTYDVHGESDYLVTLLDLAAPRTEEWGRAVREAEVLAQEAVVCDVFGDPTRPVGFADGWRTPAAVVLARTMYETGDFSAVPMLADALEEAGCKDAAVLGHCRGDGPHVKGCWVVDAVLGHDQTFPHPRPRRCA